MSDLITAIITTYKRPVNLERALKSVFSQTYENVEIIVVDDNDEETTFRAETEQIVKKYINKKNFQYIPHKNNKGGSAARNSGIKKSKGDYIAFLDDDDEWLPGKLQRQYDCLKMKGNEYGAIYCSLIYIEDEIEEEVKFVLEGSVMKEILLGEFSPGATSTLMFSRKVLLELNGFNEKFIRNQDLEILIRMFRKYKIALINDPLIIKNGYNMPNSYNLKKTKDVYFREFKDDIERMGWKVKRAIYGREYLFLARSFFKDKRFFWSLYYILLSITSDCSQLVKYITK